MSIFKHSRGPKIVTLLLSTMLSTAGSLPAAAQSLDLVTTPDRPIIDSRGVEVATGRSNVTGSSTGIAGARFADAQSGPTGYNNFRAYVATNTTSATVFVNGVSKRFSLSGSIYSPVDGDGSTLIKLNSPERYTYTAKDGTVYYFERLVSGTSNPPNLIPIRAHLMTITRPDGQKTTYHNTVVQGAQVCDRTCTYPTYIRAQSITTSDGYMLKAEYASGLAGPDFNRLIAVKAIDRSEDYCDPLADSCSGLTQSWPVQSITETTVSGVTTKTSTDGDGNATTVNLSAGRVTNVDRPLNTGNEAQITNDANGRVDLLVEDGATYDYSYSISGTTQTTTVVGPGSSTETFVVDTNISRLISETNATGSTTSYMYDAQARKTRETQPEGNYTQWTYDSRGNLTELRQVAKLGSGQSDIVSTANFDTSCTIQAKCNKPNYTIDPKGNRTDYTYDNTHGGITRVQLPAPTSGGTRPEINYVYASLYAQEKNSSGVLVNVATLQNKVTQVTTCATAATCTGSANETKITFAYATPNLLPSSKTVAAGDGSISATEIYTYDLMDNLRSVDGPLPGSDDTTFYYWTPQQNRLRGVIYPDPDGSGPLARRAERYTYLGGKPVLKTEVGTVAGTTNADLAALTVAQTVDFSYDSKGNKIKEVLTAGGIAHQVVQYSYDSKNRLECSALRMNPAIFASLPPSACTSGAAGSGANDFGSDRITQNIYDASNRVIQVKTALGSAELADELTKAYTNNGRVDYVIDAEANRTNYTFDGHDRAVITEYPVSTKGANASNGSDYEQLTFDANGNVTSRRLRDGNSIGYGYDNLNRRTSKDLPGSEPDATYSYDLLSRPLSAVQNGQTLNFTHDALGRNLTQSGPLGTVTYTYDAAGRRTAIAYPGGTSLTVGYDYDATGQVTAIKENGSTTLATYAYDNLGRRTSVTFGNGVVQSFAYDAVSRLATLSSDLAGTGYDQTATFGYNPASQIDTLAKSNDAHAWSGHYNVDRVSAGNGLNQLTAATPGGGQTSVPTLGYDARGNLTSSGASSYTYSSENFLKTGPSSTLDYDPVGRLYQTVGSTTTRFQYDDVDLIAEYNGTNALQRRYVHGPSTDNPILWYEGTGLSDKRYLTSDERGSVVALSNGSGTVTNVNAYDEYGIPASANVGRLQYTGQTWLPELGIYYYKARIYSPTLGRFMQTDPIGYSNGINWHNYVGGDPVNSKDPSGLKLVLNCVGMEGYTTTCSYKDDGLGNVGVSLWTRNRGSIDASFGDQLVSGLSTSKIRVPPCAEYDGTISGGNAGSDIPFAGDVWAVGLDVFAAFGVGGGGGYGGYYDRSTNTFGTYTITARGVGIPGAGVAVSFTNYADLSSFSGDATNLSGGGPFVGVSGSQSSNGRWGHSLTIGFRTPQLMVTQSATAIQSELPQCPVK